MKLLILTQYFPPEIGAPQNRLYELAVRLQQKGADISVLTAMPNYPQMQIHQAYKGKFYSYEEINSLKVHRAWIYVSKSKSIIIRLINYFSFVFSSLLIGFIKIKKHDILIVESPPLFLGITAYLLSRVKKAELVFNVSDLWPESAEKLGLVTNKSMLKLSTYLEEFCYRKAALITGQTQGICKNISTRFPQKKVYWLKNGVDVNFYNTDKPIERNWREENGFSMEDFILIYAGIMGYAQGLEVIIEAAKNLVNQGDIKFVFLGSGPEKEKLINLKNKFNLKNISFFEAVPKVKMQDILMATDASIIPLRKLDIFKGAIPSKIFENLALRKPIILGVEGEAKELFIDDAKAGLAFEPENANDLSQKIVEAYTNRNQLKEFGNNGYLFVKQYFSRDVIANDLWKFLNDNIKAN
jgi:glycosyltransferase involved in cell wall biosynthesis